VELHLVLLERVVVVRGSSRGKKKGGRLSLVLQRGSIRRTRGQRWSVGRGGWVNRVELGMV
jgi:hypothetical protein